MGKTYIDHKDHGHPIQGQAGKNARAKCRRELEQLGDQLPDEVDETSAPDAR